MNVSPIKNMHFFNRSETKNISLILLILFIIVGLNIMTSLRKGRDATRKNDISAVQKAVDLYRQKYKTYPLSNSDGKIVGCFNNPPEFDKKTGLVINAIPCEWGKSAFESIKTMVNDPKFDSGYSYRYVSDGQSYQFFISLEGLKEAEYSADIAAKNLQCGVKVCNYGRGSNL